jgi:hypothetical protein
MLLQTNSYVVPKEKRNEHARLVRRFRQTMATLGCDQFEVYEQVSQNWGVQDSGGRFVQIIRFRDRRHQQDVQAAERIDPAAQALIQEFCELINLPYQQQQGLFAVGYYNSVLAAAPGREQQIAGEESAPPVAQISPANPEVVEESAPPVPALPDAAPPLAEPTPVKAESDPEEFVSPEIDTRPEDPASAVEESAVVPRRPPPATAAGVDDDFAALIGRLAPEELKLAADEFAQMIARIAPGEGHKPGCQPASPSAGNRACDEPAPGSIEQNHADASWPALLLDEVPPAVEALETVSPPSVQEVGEETVGRGEESVSADDIAEPALVGDSEFSDYSADDSSISPFSEVAGPRLVRDDADSDPVLSVDLQEFNGSERFAGDDLTVGEDASVLESQADMRIAEAGEAVEPHEVEALVERADAHDLGAGDEENPGGPANHLEGHREIEPRRNGNDQIHLTPSPRPRMRLAMGDDQHDHSEEQRDIELFEPDEPVSPFGT